MQKPSLLIFVLSLLFFSACKSDGNQKEELTPKEKIALDSISKAQQKYKVDSLKKKNPLLILPPDSVYTGDYTDKYASGITKFKGYYRFGKRHGQWMSFYPNGLKWSELFYDKGLREGPNTTYFESGKIRYEGFYKHDMQDSIWNYYDTLGKLAVKVLYRKDKLVKKIPLQ